MRIKGLPQAECDFGQGFYMDTGPLQPLTLVCIQKAIIDHLDGLTAKLKRLEKIAPDSYVPENIRYLQELIAKLNQNE